MAECSNPSRHREPSHLFQSIQKDTRELKMAMLQS